VEEHGESTDHTVEKAGAAVRHGHGRLEDDLSMAKQHVVAAKEAWPAIL
jgi:hypothetical protein